MSCRQNVLEDLGHDIRQRQPGDGAGEADDGTLDQQLPRDAGSRRAEGGANAHLGLPPGRPGEQQVGDVRAGDEQHEADRRQQNERRIPHLRHDDFMEAPHPRRHVGIGMGSDLLGLPGDLGQLGLGLCWR